MQCYNTSLREVNKKLFHTVNVHYLHPYLSENTEFVTTTGNLKKLISVGTDLMK